MRVGRLFQFFFCVCSICNSWRSHAGTGCESRGARGWDAWRVAAASLLVACFPFPSLPFPSPLLNTCFCLALAEPVTRLGLPICLSRPVRGPWIEGGHVAGTRVPTYVPYNTGGEGGDRPPTTTTAAQKFCSAGLFRDAG